MLHACYPGFTGDMWSANAPAAWVWLSRGAPPGAVSGQHGPAPAAGGGAPPHARPRPGARSPSALTAGGCPGGGSGRVLLCASRTPRAGWQTPRAARVGATDRRVPARAALGQAGCAANASRHRRATGPLAPTARRPGPTRHLVETDDQAFLARPGDLGGPASSLGTPRGAHPPGQAWGPDPPDHARDDAPRRGTLPRGRPRRTVPPAWAR